MATTALTPVQQKAIDLRGYLHQDGVKDTLQDAMPRWLSVDRMLRIVFSSAMRNPKLLECTKESILQSVMMCAQLGLEPILGRAYLIPYHNSKNIGGKWTKVYECQMQLGYQGLIDLARRSDNIADVWGSNVYENDLFSLNFGMDRDLTHNPWYMDPEKRKKGSGGEIIGAYVVWQLKDGTKHPDFMPISEIHKRRERSQAYTWAETGDPKKGGGKSDSVWHQWPEEMNLKTVIKHSAKMVPSSIEFMSAVTMDNDSELGRQQINPLSFDLPALGNDGGHLLTSESDLVEQFDNIMAAQYGADDLQALTDFIVMTGERSGDLSLTEVKIEVMREKDIGNFCNAFESYLQRQKETTTDQPAAETETASTDAEKPEEAQTTSGTASSWNPFESEIQKRYGEDKREKLKSFADDIGIDTEGRLPREIHQELIDHAEKQREPTTTAKSAPHENNPDDDAMAADMEMLNTFNELWATLPADGKEYACPRAKCKVTVNGFQRPSKENMPEWIEAAKQWMADSVDDSGDDGITPFDDGGF